MACILEQSENSPLTVTVTSGSLCVAMPLWVMLLIPGASIGVENAGSYLPGVRGTLVESLLVNLTMNPVIGTAGSVWIPRLPREASSAETRAMVILSGARVRGGIPSMSARPETPCFLPTTQGHYLAR